MWGSLDTLPWNFVSTALKLQLLSAILPSVEGNDSKVCRAGDPLREHLSHMGPEGLSSRAIHLYVPKVPQGRVTFRTCMTIPIFHENAGGHGHPGQSAIVTLSSKVNSSDGG